MLERDAVRILVSELTDIELKRELELVVDLLAFESVVVQFNPVQAESEHRREAADALAHELSGFRLAGLALNAIQFFKAKEFIKGILNAFFALHRQHQI